MASFIFDSFKGHLLSGNISLSSSPLYVILMKSTYSPNDDTQVKYSDISSSEIVQATNSGYTTGGKILTSQTVTVNTGSSYSVFSAANTTWTSSTISASGAVLYASGSNYGGIANPLIGFIDFGSTLSSSNGDFTLQWNSNGIIRINNG